MCYEIGPIGISYKGFCIRFLSNSSTVLSDFSIHSEGYLCKFILLFPMIYLLYRYEYLPACEHVHRMCACSPHVCVFTSCVQYLPRTEKVLEHLELELQVVVSFHVGDGNETWVLFKISKCS